MIIVSLKQHFPARLPEWWMSAVLLVWGLYVMTHPHIFTDPATRDLFSGMAAMTGYLDPARVWGGSAVMIGGVRAVALFINGAYTRTPMIRLCMSFLSAFIWTQVSIGFVNSGVANTGVVVYASMVVLDIMSAYRATTDMVFAWTIGGKSRTRGQRHVEHNSFT